MLIRTSVIFHHLQDIRKYLQTIIMRTYLLLHCCTGRFTGERGCSESRDVHCFAKRKFFACVCGEDTYVISHTAQGPVCTLVSVLGGELVAAARGNPKRIAKRVDAPIQETGMPTTMAFRHIEETVLGLLHAYPVTNIPLPLVWV